MTAGAETYDATKDCSCTSGVGEGVDPEPKEPGVREPPELGASGVREPSESEVSGVGEPREPEPERRG